MIHIQLQSEYIGSALGMPITNTFLTSVLVTILFCICAAVFSVNNKNEKSVFVKIIRVIVYEILTFIDMVTGDREFSKRIFPIVATLFLFILGANLLAMTPGFFGAFFVNTPRGLIPLLRSPNSDLTTTAALALFGVFFSNFYSLRILGMRDYVKRFLNLASPIQFLVGFFELVSEAVKVLSFSFRLFGNIFAGEVLLLVVAFLAPYILPVPFLILEVFVGIIQAFIFSVLVLTFMKTSTMRHTESKAHL